jgi:hypothetical protein
MKLKRFNNLNEESSQWEEHYGTDSPMKQKIHDKFLSIMQEYYDETGDIIEVMSFGAIGVRENVVSGEGFKFETEPGSEFKK